MKTAKQHNSELCGEIEFLKQASKINYAISQSRWRFVSYDKSTKRIELAGRFTVKDLQLLAEWLKNPTDDIPELSKC